MKGRLIYLMILLNLIGLLALLFIYPQQMISTGPLIDGHHELEGDCFACHTLLLGSDDDKCIECHSVAKIGRFTSKGVPLAAKEEKVLFHQQLSEPECDDCHSDHQQTLSVRRSARFSHQLLKRPLREQCEQCHQKPKNKRHRNLKTKCHLCHSSKDWYSTHFDHSDHFRFDKHHRKCSRCHQDRDYSRYSCYGCHEHKPAKMREEHAEAGIFEFEKCVECHRSSDGDEAQRIWREKQRQ